MINVLYSFERGNELECNSVFLLPPPLALPSVTLLSLSSPRAIHIERTGNETVPVPFFNLLRKEIREFFARMKVFKICFSITSILVRPGL